MGAGWLPPWEVAASQRAPVRLGVLVAQPADHAPERVVVEVAERARADAVAEVGAPAPQYRVEPVEELVERVVVAAPGDRFHLGVPRFGGHLSAWSAFVRLGGKDAPAMPRGSQTPKHDESKSPARAIEDRPQSF